MTSYLKEKIGIREVGALTLWVRSIVKTHYNVRFDQRAETAYVDGHKNMVIPLPNEKMTLRDAIRLRGFCLHETSHPMYQPKIFDIMKENPTKPGSPLGMVYNVLLDVHCETMRANEWPGDGKALSEFGAVIGHDVYEKISKQMAALSSKDIDTLWEGNFGKMSVLLTAARNAEALWNTGMLLGFERLVNEIYPQWVRDKAEELESRFNLKGRLVEGCEKETEESIWQLSKEIYEWLWEKDSEEEMQPKDGKGGKEDKEGDEKGDESEDGEGEGKAAGVKPEMGDGGEEKSDVKPEEKIKITELLFSDHYETLTGGGHGQGFDYTNYKEYSVYHPVDPKTFNVIDYNKRGVR